MLPIFDVLLQNSFSSTKSESFVLLAVYDTRSIRLNREISNACHSFIFFLYYY